MTEDETNVVAFAPRPQPAPVLAFCEVTLNDDCSLTLTVHDDAGNVAAVLSYGLQDKPEGFDMSRLAEAWDIWRGSSTKAS